MQGNRLDTQLSRVFSDAKSYSIVSSLLNLQFCILIKGEAREEMYLRLLRERSIERKRKSVGPACLLV